MHPNSLKNLRPPAKPGEVLNPEGINRKRPFTDEYHEFAVSALPDEIRTKVNEAYQKQFGIVEFLKAGTTWARAQILRQEIQALLEPAVHLTSEFADRVEGKTPQRLELTGMERQEITIVVIQEQRLLPKKAQPPPPIDVKPIPPLPPPSSPTPNGNKSTE
jgi:hypothetical protein